MLHNGISHLNSEEDFTKEIVNQLDCGFRVFIHNITGQILCIPDEDRFFDIDLES